MDSEESFLVKSIDKYISMFGGNLAVDQGQESNGNFSVRVQKFDFINNFFSCLTLFTIFLLWLRGQEREPVRN
jgi:hypothetical protein